MTNPANPERIDMRKVDENKIAEIDVELAAYINAESGDFVERG